MKPLNNLSGSQTSIPVDPEGTCATPVEQTRGNFHHCARCLVVGTSSRREEWPHLRSSITSTRCGDCVAISKSNTPAHDPTLLYISCRSIRERGAFHTSWLWLGGPIPSPQQRNCDHSGIGGRLPVVALVIQILSDSRDIKYHLRYLLNFTALIKDTW